MVAQTQKAPTELDQVIIRIFRRIIDLPFDGNYSLFGGLAGRLLFAAQYYLHATDEQEKADACDFLCQGLSSLAAVSHHHLQDHSLCSGKAGIHWLFEFIYQKGLITAEERKSLCAEDDLLRKYVLSDLRQLHYDYLYGGAGVGQYFLFKKPARKLVPFLHELASAADTLFVGPGRLVPLWDHQCNRLRLSYVNLGLAHGILAVLKLLTGLFQRNVRPELCYRHIVRITDFFRTAVNREGDSVFPYRTHFQQHKDENSRLGWCYGDLVAGYLLLQAGQALNHPETLAFSLEILDKCTERITVSQTGIRDAGFCHGSAGVAHIFNKVYQCTRLARFRTAAEMWIRRTIHFAAFDGDAIAFRIFESGRKEHPACDNLLEGAAGIGLVLQSHLNRDFTWDSCLMLND